jgi:hypothetical protein
MLDPTQHDLWKRPRVRIARAASACGIPRENVASWMKKRKIRLFSEQSGGGWREFSPADIGLLALTGEILPWVGRIEDANDVARSCFQGKVDIDPEFRVPAGVLATMYLGPRASHALMIVRRADGELGYATYDMNKPDKRPDTWLAHLKDGPKSAVIIPLLPVVSVAIARALDLPFDEPETPKADPPESQ